MFCDIDDRLLQTRPVMRVMLLTVLLRTLRVQC